MPKTGAKKARGIPIVPKTENRPAIDAQGTHRGILPTPCTVGFDDWTVKQWFGKINEELDELKEAVNLELGTNVHNARHQVPVLAVAEEAADTITAITSMLEAMGIDENMRQKAQRNVNERNAERKRL